MTSESFYFQFRGNTYVLRHKFGVDLFSKQIRLIMSLNSSIYLIGFLFWTITGKLKTFQEGISKPYRGIYLSFYYRNVRQIDTLYGQMQQYATPVSFTYHWLTIALISCQPIDTIQYFIEENHELKGFYDGRFQMLGQPQIPSRFTYLSDGSCFIYK